MLSACLYFFLLHLPLLLQLVHVDCLIYVETRISQGGLRGLVLKTPNNREFLAFLGIPYATPPVGQLRFKPSIPFPAWNTVLDSTKFRPCCPQFDFRGNILGNENCLFLNVFTPRVNSFRETNLFPVMVYIQAESFENGDSALYGAEKLVDKGVVVVTFNYRLGILGFLSTGDDSASGNWGLHDQKLALEWVRENIGAFSGDPNSVTIFGQGAGAASVIFHLISPLTQGLFHRAIAQSGSALCEWAVERNPLQFTREVAQTMGCPIERTYDIVDCLRKTPFPELLRSQSKGKTFGEFPQRAAPVVERWGSNRFIPEDPKVLLQRGSFQRVPLMAGINKDETSYFYPLLVKTNELREGVNNLEKTLLPRFLDATTVFKGLRQNTVIHPILLRYFNLVERSNISDVSLRFVNMSTDALYLSCVDETLKLYSRHLDAPAYMYVFGYRGQNTLINQLVGNQLTLFNTGVCHGDELFYLFDLKVDDKRVPTFLDNAVAERLLILWTDFAKHGHAPFIVNYEYPKWERFHSERPNYYRIDHDLRPEFAYKQSESYFWSHHLPSLYGILPHVSSSLSNLTRPMYKTLAWAMVVVSLSLLVLIVILLAVLYYQRKSQSFRAQPAENGSRISGGSSTLY